MLDKLRYMRGREPIPGYDALSVEEIVAVLKPADLVTLKKVRAYERKFANRPDVLEEVVRDLHLIQADRPGDNGRPGPTGRTRGRGAGHPGALSALPAMAYGPRPSSARRLLELERAAMLSAGCLQRAKAEHDSGAPD